MVKNLPASAGDVWDGFDPWVGKIPWKRAWQPTQVFLSGESHRQRSLVGYIPQGCKESDTTEVTVCTHACISETTKFCSVLSGQNILSVFVVCVLSLSVLSNSLHPHGLQPTSSFVHGIFQTRIAEWVAITYFRGSSWHRDQNRISCFSCIGREILYCCHQLGSPWASLIHKGMNKATNWI